MLNRFKCFCKKGGANIAGLIIALVVVGILAFSSMDYTAETTKSSAEDGFEQVAVGTQQTVDQLDGTNGTPSSGGGNANAGGGETGGSPDIACPHSSTQIINTSETYTGDLICIVCNKVLQTGYDTETCEHDTTEIRDASVSYTGDTYCINCNKKISSGTYGTAYAVYSATDNSLRFYKRLEEIKPRSVYNGLVATAVYTGFEITNYNYQNYPWFSYRNKIKSVIVEDEGIKPRNTSYWFYSFSNCSVFNVEKLDTSNTLYMDYTFYEGGDDVTSTVTIIGVDKWDTSLVESMKCMFNNLGNSANTVIIGDLSNWDVSSVKNMQGMFHMTGNIATAFTLLGIENWDVSSVENMSQMFYQTGGRANFSLNLSKWDVGNVTYRSEFVANPKQTKIIEPLWV